MEHTPQNARPNEFRIDILNPFEKRAKLARSPTRSAPPATEAVASSSTIPASNQIVENDGSDENAFVTLGRLINDLKEVIDSGKRSINQTFRDLVKAVAVSYEQVAEQLSDAQVIEKNTKQSQTTPSLRHIATLQSVKRARERVPGDTTSPQIRPKRHKVNGRSGLNEKDGTGNAASETTKAAEEDRTWTTVTKPKRAKKKPARPDAIVVKSTGECTYADILKAVKSEEALKGMNTMVRKVRKTANGDLLFQLAKPSDANTAKLKAAVGQLLIGKAEVKSLTEESLVDIRDIDEVTTMEEVCLALNSQIPDIEINPSNIRSLRKAYGGTQTATISLPSVVAKKLIEVGKVRIGWVICRIRAKVQPRRCFKCLDFGHMSRNCASRNDYSSACFKCGEDGHTAKSCTNAPKCILCVKRGNDHTDHYTGGPKCTVYQAALEKLKQL